MTKDSESFLDDMESEAASAPKPVVNLDAINKMGKTAAELQSEITRLEARTKELKTKQYQLLNKEMPSAMDELQVGYIGVDGYELRVQSYYKANIAADDPEEVREEAFAWVEQAGGGDIISNVVTVAFPKEDSAAAAEFYEEISRRFDNQRSVAIKREKAVPWNRLTSWLKDYVETPPVKGKTKLPVPLELLHATIGRVVKIKPVKE